MNPISLNATGLRQGVPPTVQADAVLNQAAPVQNTWYPVLALTPNVRLINVSARIADTGEDVAVRITVDGIELSAVSSLVANTSYFYTIEPDNAANILSNDVSSSRYRAFLMEGKSVKVDIRKTSALGVGNLICRVKYAKW